MMVHEQSMESSPCAYASPQQNTGDAEVMKSWVEDIKHVQIVDSPTRKRTSPRARVDVCWRWRGRDCWARSTRAIRCR